MDLIFVGYMLAEAKIYPEEEFVRAHHNRNKIKPALSLTKI